MFIQWIKFCGIKTERVKSEEGFTLLEVILVFVVMSILSSTIVLPFITSLNSGTKADIHATAAQLAAADIEDLRGKDFATIMTEGGTSGTSTLVSTTINNRSYDRQYTYEQQTSSWPLGVATLSPGAGNYLWIAATVTETVSNPDVVVTMYGLISVGYD